MITQAYIQNISPQTDGRKYVTEIQTDDQLGDLEFFYLAEVSDDPEAIMAARTVELNSQQTDGS